MYWVTGILGFIFAISPLLFHYSENTPALWTSLILGFAVMIVSYLEGAARDKEQWEYIVAILTGVAAIAAPFLLGFEDHPTAMGTTVAIGGILAFIAVIKLFMADTDLTDLE